MTLPMCTIIMRHGLETKATVTMTETDFTALLRHKPEEIVRHLIAQVEPAEPSQAAAMQATLQEPSAIIELRQGNSVSVVTRGGAFPSVDATAQSPLEIGLHRTSYGG